MITKLLVLALVFTDLAYCSSGSTYKEFVVVDVKVNWHRAYMFCRGQNMTLATIDSDAEQQSLQRKIVEAQLGFKTNFWIGATDLHEEGKWRWMGNGKSQMPYTNWLSGEPNNERNSEHCAVGYSIWADKIGWNDVPCSLNLFFVCEYYEHV